MPSTTTTWSIPFPVGTDRVMDGDNDIQKLAERVDLLLGGTGGAGGGGTLPANAPGLWQTATGVTVCTDVTLAAQPGSSITYAKFMKIGKTVWFQGDATTTTAVTPIVGISLPNGLAGVPKLRYVHCGGLYCMGSAPPSDQSGVAVMGPSSDRLLLTGFTGGYRQLPASHTLRWSVVYEVA